MPHPPRRNESPRDRNRRVVYSLAVAERARRRHLRDTVLRDLPRPGEKLPDAGRFRYDLWPPRPPRRNPGRPGPHADRDTPRDPDALLGLLGTFANARGPNFPLLEFLAWSGVGVNGLYDAFGSWPAMRAAAGLPAKMAPRTSEMLHRLLCAYDLFLAEHRRKPTAPELARKAGTSVGPINTRGGIHALADLHAIWTHDAAWHHDARRRDREQNLAP